MHLKLRMESPGESRLVKQEGFILTAALLLIALFSSALVISNSYTHSYLKIQRTRQAETESNATNEVTAWSAYLMNKAGTTAPGESQTPDVENTYESEIGTMAPSPYSGTGYTAGQPLNLATTAKFDTSSALISHYSPGSLTVSVGSGATPAFCGSASYAGDVASHSRCLVKGKASGATAANLGVDGFPVGVQLQPDGKIVVVGYLLSDPATGASVPWIVRMTTDGDFDQTFNGNGLLQPNMASAGNIDANPVDWFQPLKLVVQSDGKIVTLMRGGSLALTDSLVQYWVTRFNSDGSFDTSFGGNGTGSFEVYQAPFSPSSVLDPTSNNIDVLDLALDSAGNVVLSGRTQWFNPAITWAQDTGVGTGYWVLVPAFWRYLPNGTPDPSFGAWQTAPAFPTQAPLPGEVMIVPPGNLTGHSPLSGAFSYKLNVEPGTQKIISVGTYMDSQSSPMNITNMTYTLWERLNPDGSLDTSFGTNGYTLQQPRDALPSPMKDMVVYGPPANLMFDPTGTKAYWVTSYSVWGTVSGHGNVPFYYSVKSEAGSIDITTGAPNTALGPEGLLWVQDYNPPFDTLYIYGLGVLPSGNLVMTGWLVGFTDSSQDGAPFVSYQPNGAVDSTFNGGNYSTHSVPFLTQNTDLVVQPDGKIVTVGIGSRDWSGVDGYLIVARFNTDGTPDTTFGIGGANP